jgi:cytochrome bd ubiquinol oxidase subunit I
MDALDLARLQFAVTTVFHFFFVPLSMGLSILIAVMQTNWYRTGNEKWLRMTKFFGTLFLINFAVGVVTGIVQEFQFGMNWSEYSRFVGDIFGAPLAIEALMAFFIESTFLGLWIFGWDKLSKRVHLACIWMVAFGANISALWILLANSFMQNPVGYEINEVTGRAEMTDFGALITNEYIFTQYPHVVLGALTTSAFFVVGISAFRLVREISDGDREVFSTALTLGMVVGLVSVIATMGFGHMSGQKLSEVQPMKLAAAEGLWEDADPAGLSIFEIGDEVNRDSIVDITVPYVLSFMVYETPTGEVRGINSLQAEYEETYGPGDYVPPVWISYWSFRAMVGAGMAMMVLAVVGLFLTWRGNLLTNKWVMRGLMLSLFLPYIANSTGWILAEVGRQPWIVFGVMTVEDAVSPNVAMGTVAISLVGFTAVYSFLTGLYVFLTYKYAKEDTRIIPAESMDPHPETQPALDGAY